MVVSVNNFDNSPVRIKVFRNLYDSLPSTYYANKRVDTLRIPIDRYSVFLVSNKNVYTDTLYLNAGDTVRVNVLQGQDRVNVKGTNYQFEEEPDQLDSLYSLFYTSEPKNELARELAAMLKNEPDIVTDFERIQVSLKYSPDTEYYQNNPEQYNFLVNQLIALLNHNHLDLKEVGTQEKNSLDTLEGHLKNLKSFDSLKNLYSFSKDPAILIKLFNSQSFTEEQLANNPFGKGYLLYFIREVVLEGKPDRSKSMEYWDYKKAYDLSSNFFQNQSSLKFAREVALEEMMEYREPYEQVVQYLNKYMQTYSDSLYVKEFNQNFLADYDRYVREKEGLNLLRADGSVLRLEDVLNEHKDKIVYVDYWASWCLPCLKAMVHSKALRDVYEEKGVSFVYLNIDNDLSKWKKAATKHGLFDHPQNFLALNQTNSDLTDSLQIQALPRYLVFSNGRLINSDAPGPESPKIKELFDIEIEQNVEVKK